MIVDKLENSMSNLYLCHLQMDGRSIHSPEQMYSNLISAFHNKSKQEESAREWALCQLTECF